VLTTVHVPGSRSTDPICLGPDEPARHAWYRHKAKRKKTGRDDDRIGRIDRMKALAAPGDAHRTILAVAFGFPSRPSCQSCHRLFLLLLVLFRRRVRHVTYLVDVGPATCLRSIGTRHARRSLGGPRRTRTVARGSAGPRQRCHIAVLPERVRAVARMQLFPQRRAHVRVRAVLE
jgi:hypothetical protein